MKFYWTSKESLNGLKHFVVVNKYKEKSEYYYEIVAVLDDSVNFKISKTDFQKSDKWEPGFVDYKEENILIDEYREFKLKSENEKKFYKILVKKSSPFNIS